MNNKIKTKIDVPWQIIIAVIIFAIIYAIL